MWRLSRRKPTTITCLRTKRRYRQHNTRLQGAQLCFLLHAKSIQQLPRFYRSPTQTRYRYSNMRRKTRPTRSWVVFHAFMFVLAGVCRRGPSRERLQGIISTLRSNKVVVCPASDICTFNYSLHSPGTVRQLHHVGNGSTRTFAIIFRGLTRTTRCYQISGTTFHVLGHGLPKPFAFMLATSSNVPSGTLRGQHAVKVHVPNGTIPQTVITTLKYPLVAASIGSSSRIIRCAVSPRLVRRQCNHSITLIVSNNINSGIPAAIISLANSRPRVLHRNGNRLR